MTLEFLTAPLLVLASAGGTTIYVDDDNWPFVWCRADSGAP